MIIVLNRRIIIIIIIIIIITITYTMYCDSKIREYSEVACIKKKKNNNNYWISDDWVLF
jgi:hypothetical protein